MKNFFKNLSNKTKAFASKHRFLFKSILEVLLGILYVAWAILMLYQFSLILLSGIEKQSAIRIALAIAGYIFIAWYTYWITFSSRNEDDLRSLQHKIRDIQIRQRSTLTNQILSAAELKVSMLEQKYEIEDGLRDIERKLDKLLEQNK